MITYLRHEQIDRGRWDACLMEIPAVRPYAMSWYLDIISPGWEALMDDDYLALFPLPRRRKYGFTYAATPLFLQQLGLFTADGDHRLMADEFVSFMPSFYRLIDLAVGQQVNVAGYSITRRDNYELIPERTYEEVWQHYTSDCRRNINLARSFPQEIVSDITPAELITLYISHTALKSGVRSRSALSRLRHLMEHCLASGTGTILGVRSPRGELLWGMFIIEFMSRTTMLLTAGSRRSREQRTSYLVIDHIIGSHAGTGQIIDFAGSSIPSVAAFIKSFGGVRSSYWRLFRNELPWPVRLLKEPVRRAAR